MIYMSIKFTVGIERGDCHIFLQELYFVEKENWCPIKKPNFISTYKPRNAKFVTPLFAKFIQVITFCLMDNDKY